VNKSRFSAVSINHRRFTHSKANFINCNAHIGSTYVTSTALLPSKRELALIIFDGVKNTFRGSLPDKNLDWLTMSSDQVSEINKRLNIMKTNPDKTYSYNKKYELEVFLALRKICAFLTKNHSCYFKYLKDGKYIKNCLTHKVYPLYSGNPLLTLGGLIVQDINILAKVPDSAEPILVGSITVYSVGWSVGERLNYSLSDLHKKVPSWITGRIGALKFFKDLYSNKVESLFRTNCFVQVGSVLAYFNKENYVNSLQTNKILFEKLYLRREYQVFMRLSDDVVIFSVETHIAPLSNFNLSELKTIYSHFSKLGPESQNYHSFNIWGPVLYEEINKQKKNC
jgi:Protein of unknown function (DUF3445)